MAPSIRRSARATQTSVKDRHPASTRTSAKSTRPKTSRRTAQSSGSESERGYASADVKDEKVERESDSTGEVAIKPSDKDDKLAARKVSAWTADSNASPYPDFGHPTVKECQIAHRVLGEMHQSEVDKEFEDPDTPETIPHVLDAMIVGVLSQATGWSNAKRAMAGMREAYGSVFAYDNIIKGGMDKLRDALKPGGLHVRKSGLIMGILDQVKKEYPDWNMDRLFDVDDQVAMQELIKYKGIGPKSASVVMTWCLKRKSFTVDTHVYRIAGLWKWRPESAPREKTQAHLDAVIPDELKFDLHFLLIQHGRVCPACRGGAKAGQSCTAKEEMIKQMRA